MIEFLNEFTSFFVQMIVFYFIGQFIIMFIQGWLEAKNAELEAVVKHIDQLIREVKVEQHGDVIYWFDAENNSFIAQGRTQEEIATTLQKRFPKNVFMHKQELFAGPDFKPILVDIEDARKLAKKFKL